ncbi:MAG: hypothetical protein ACI8VJ_000414, partial [Polaribacter sp.]
MRILSIFLCVLMFSSCDYIMVQEKEGRASEIIAIVNTDK